MSYSAPLIHQLDVFLVFLGVGFLLGAVYTFVAFFRRLTGETAAACFVCDFLFCALSSVVLFLFLLAYANGRVRINLLLSAGAGFAAFSLSLGKPLRRVLFGAADAIHHALLLLLRPLKHFWTAMIRGLGRGQNRLRAFFIRRKQKKLTKNSKNCANSIK